MTKQDQIKIIEKLSEELKSSGVTEFMSISKSETSFGASTYLYVGDTFKVRASDHSVGTSRLLNELHVNDLSFNFIFQTIERYFFPERYEKVVSLEFGDSHEATEKKISSLIKNGVDFKYIEKDFKTSKKGNKISMIQVRNMEEINYIKIG